MNHVWGILAHVDAGKTTLSESILYTAGQLAKTGRVDHGDAFLDTDSQEKKRGITIFSKPAVFTYQDVQMTLLDTPGHVDFATETERAVWALDYAILLISGTDGVQAHTKTLYRILKSIMCPRLSISTK
ncbi:MAG: GTP-binding protein [Lachnospiraceae bacterium]|nr:GTP-binding protein [Lachnospiraceae bacterium]